MDEKKYKDRVAELKALDARLSESRTIAATIDEANALKQKAMVHEEEAKKLKAALEDEHRVRTQKLNDEVQTKKLMLDERAAKEREQYADVRKMLSEATEKYDAAAKLQLALKQQTQSLAKWDDELKERETNLALKIKKVNEAFNG